MRLGFDFDKVFIDYPPLIPSFLIDFLYKGGSVFKRRTNTQGSLHYRIPGRVEQHIRILSHYPIFRSLIRKNAKALRGISQKKTVRTYLISSRFSFLKERTNVILDKYKLKKYFDGIYFNYDNKQPHQFKEEIIKKLKIHVYIDDDLQLVLYLSKNNPELKLFWIKNGSAIPPDLPSNVTPAKDLADVRKWLNI